MPGPLSKVLSLPDIHFAVPGPIDQPTGGYLYDRHMVNGLRARGHKVKIHEMRGSFPLADETARQQAEHVQACVKRRETLVVDGLALPAFSKILNTNGPVAAALIHHPLALETGLPAATRSNLHRLEMDCLQNVSLVIATSPATAKTLKTDYNLKGKVFVVRPGTAPVTPFEPKKAACVQLLCVGAVVPRKGHEILIAALAACASVDWRLVCVGALDRAPDHVAALQAEINRLNLGHRIEMTGAVNDSALHGYYRNADIFVLPSHYEGYGMAFVEALAYGLPIIGSGGGAVRHTVPPLASVMVPVGDVSALSAAIARVASDFEYRRVLAAGARKAAQSLPAWDESVAAFETALFGGGA